MVMYVEAGAFGAHPGHDAHILSTLSAIQILVMQDALHRADVNRLVQCKSQSCVDYYTDPSTITKPDLSLHQMWLC